MKSSGSADRVISRSRTIFSIEPFGKEDELVEVTPETIRLRKKILESNKRQKNRDKMD